MTVVSATAAAQQLEDTCRHSRHSERYRWEVVARIVQHCAWRDKELSYFKRPKQQAQRVEQVQHAYSPLCLSFILMDRFTTFR
jgi:hypothetical protein